MLNTHLTDRLVDALLKLPGIEAFGTRTALLNGIPVALNRAENHFVDLSNIITQIDGLGRLQNGERPAVILAHNALRMVRGTELGRLLETIERDLEQSYGEESLLADLPTTPEALIFGGAGEWVTSAFLKNAGLVGAAVARLRVPRIVNGNEELPLGALGTGWLIGDGLLLTNYHVVEAREPGEPRATNADFLAQGKASTAWFDYYMEGRDRVEADIAEVVCSKSSLDYALLRLADIVATEKRTPVSLPQTAPELGRGTRLNVVQCPNGGPLRFAIRNNFFVGRGTKPFQVRYLTDTDHGSSGSPVLDDNWQAVALHHGAQKVDPKLYQGDPGFQGVVKYHNEGIDIQSIVADFPAPVAAKIREAQGWT
jgi:endonuclease G